MKYDVGLVGFPRVCVRIYLERAKAGAVPVGYGRVSCPM